MIHYYAKTEGRLTELDQARPNCWVHIAPPLSQQELEEVARRYELPLDFLTDSLDIDERSRYEREEEARLIVINTPIVNEIQDDNDALYLTVPIGIVLTVDHFITISAFENPVLQLFLEDKVRNFRPDDHELFVLQLFEQSTYQYLACLKKLNLKRNLIEKELYNSSRNRELRQLLSIEKTLVYFVNSLSANDLVKKKMKRTDFLSIHDDEEKSDLFEDIIIDNSQALEMAHVYSNILSGTMDAYASIISNNLNVNIHRLTLITIFLAVPTLVASIYGMNIPLPFQEEGYALYIVLAIAIAISMLIGWYFQRKRFF